MVRCQVHHWGSIEVRTSVCDKHEWRSGLDRGRVGCNWAASGVLVTTADRSSLHMPSQQDRGVSKPTFSVVESFTRWRMVWFVDRLPLPVDGIVFTGRCDHTKYTFAAANAASE